MDEEVVEGQDQGKIEEEVANSPQAGDQEMVNALGQLEKLDDQNQDDKASDGDVLVGEKKE